MSRMSPEQIQKIAADAAQAAVTIGVAGTGRQNFEAQYVQLMVTLNEELSTMLADKEAELNEVATAYFPLLPKETVEKQTGEILAAVRKISNTSMLLTIHAGRPGLRPIVRDALASAVYMAASTGDEIGALQDRYSAQVTLPAGHEEEA